MKLQHKIAGTILLPLAAAAMTTTVQAADVTTYGRIQAHINLAGDDSDFQASAAESRLGFKQDNGQGAKAHLEFGLSGDNETKENPYLRHAYVTFSNITVGQTWKPSTALELLFPVLDPTANAASSAPAARKPQVSTMIDAGSAKITAGIYDNAAATGSDQTVPSFGAKAVLDMGGMKVVGAFDMTQPGASSGDATTTLNAGVVADLGGMTAKGAFRTDDDVTWIGGSVSMAMGEGMSLNAAYETETEASKNNMWVNVKTKLQSGVDVGAEFRSLDEVTTIGGMVNYNF